ncbi:MAG: 4-hydroxythreonine-4-phosphate dehydrogenase PdxA [bacterium]|nr:4-hydroxythreonine-4-phosphate dehydrogenase PdxA [bacterium]
MLSCLMIADDFTGACDSGMQFARSGLRSVVVTDATQGVLWGDGVEVLVVDTESRNCSRGEAADRVGAACSHLSALKPRLVYKKVDSALRGHLATEIYTVMETLGMDLCLMAPAFPEAGRVTVGGYHLVHGVPVERTEVGHDPGAPVRGSFLGHLLDIEEKLTIRSIGLEDIARGADHIQGLIEGMVGAGPTVIVMDAAASEDLREIATAGARLSPTPLFCGSAGLAACVPRAFELEGEGVGVTEAHWDGASVLTVVGSAESTTRNQVAALREVPGVSEWEIHAEATEFAWERPHLSNLVIEVHQHLEQGRDAIVSLVGLREGLSREGVGDAIGVLAEVTGRLVEQGALCGIIASGGWTAAMVLERLGGKGVEILEEVATGVALCRVRGGPYDGIPLVTKGGALGEEDAFVRAVDRLKARVDDADRPLLGITMGDVCGVGPEVIAKALAHPEVYRLCRPLVIGHPAVLRAQLEFVGARISVREVASPEGGRYRAGEIDVWNPLEVDLEQIETGRVCREAGRAAAEWVIAAADLAMVDRIDGIVTAPLNKEAMNLAGYRYAGHTELLAHQTGTDEVRLMLASERLNVVHVTGHVALHDVPERLTTERVFDTIALIHDALKGMGKVAPRIAVCGLNPHAGESGLFGEEDAESIRPAVEQALANGWDVDGPLPGDTTFFKAFDGLYDGVVAMYHDQGHVPVKLVAFADAVNVTLGLPIVRTSVDHGTAFDIAGKGIAREFNMLQTIRLGTKLAVQRKRNQA